MSLISLRPFLQGHPDEDIRAILRENYEDLIVDCRIAVDKLIKDQQAATAKENPKSTNVDSAILENVKIADTSANNDIVLRIPSLHRHFLAHITNQETAITPKSQSHQSLFGTIDSDSQKVNISLDTSHDIPQRYSSAPNLNAISLGRFDTQADFEMNTAAVKKVVGPIPKIRRASFAGVVSTPSAADFELNNAFRIIGDNNSKQERPRRKSMMDSR